MEPIRLVTPKRLESDAKAEVVRTGTTMRLAKAGSIAIGGTILGVATILIPVAHFVTTWAIPLLSIGIGIYVFRMGPDIRRIVGTCPVCSAAIDSPGGTSAPDLWIRCTECGEALHPTLLDAPPT